LALQDRAIGCRPEVNPLAERCSAYRGRYWIRGDHIEYAVTKRSSVQPRLPAETGEFSPSSSTGERRGLSPEKSHWCRPIEKPPFRAFPIISANCFTFGGLKVNTHAQVLDCDGEVMPGRAQLSS
jgi:hypothetical protein